MESWAVGQGEMGRGVRGVRRPAGHGPSPSWRAERGGRRRPWEQDTGRPALAQSASTGPEGHRDTGGLQRGRVSPECPGLLPERGRSHGQTHKASGRSCGEGRASGSGRLVLGVWTPAQLGSCGRGVPSLRRGAASRGEECSGNTAGPRGDPSAGPHVCPPLFSAPECQ